MKRKTKRKSLPRPMRWEECTEQQWAQHREDLLANSHAGQRPRGWWQHESPAPRDHRVNEALQLYRLGVLSRAEMDALMPFWREWETKARSGLFFARRPNDILEGDAAYKAWRQWAGIPSDLFPPRKPLAKIFDIIKSK